MRCSNSTRTALGLSMASIKATSRKWPPPLGACGALGPWKPAFLTMPSRPSLRAMREVVWRRPWRASPLAPNSRCCIGTKPGCRCTISDPCTISCSCAKPVYQRNLVPFSNNRPCWPRLTLNCDLIALHHVAEISKVERAEPSANIKAWRIPQCPFPIECSAAVLDQIRREVESGRDLPGGERETGGVLFGVQEPGRMRILACRALPCEHSMGPGFVLSEKDEQRLAQLVSSPAADPALHGLQALGWYHSHLRSKIFLSARDLQIHSRYFNAPFQIALVIRPESERPARAGFFFREPSGEMRTASSYEEFILETPPPEAPKIEQPVLSKLTSPQGRTATPARCERRRTEAICPRCDSTHIRRSRRTGPVKRFCQFFGFYPYRCHECLSRFFLKTSSDLLERSRSGSRKRPEERKRAFQRTRREVLVWGSGILGFLAFLYYVIRDNGPKPDAP